MARVKTKLVKSTVNQRRSRRVQLVEPVGNIVFERHDDEAIGHNIRGNVVNQRSSLRQRNLEVDYKERLVESELAFAQLLRPRG